MYKKKFLLWLIIIISVSYMLLYASMTKDDTFIFLQFARNMLENHEMSFNTGNPTYGFTSVLWTMILFCAGKVSPYLLLNAKVLSCLFAIGAIISFYFLCQHFLKEKQWQLFATAAFALNPVFVYISCSGMETSLAVLLAVAGVGAYFEERSKNRNFYWAPLFFALAYLTRPEMLLFILLAVADIIVNVHSRRKIKIILIFLAEYSSVLIPWLAVALYNFGTVIPNPVIIKAVRSLSEYHMSYIVIRLALILGSIHTAEILLVLLAICFILWRKNYKFIFSFVKENMFVLLWICSLLSSYLVRKVSVSPRYLLIVSPFITLVVFILLEHISTLFTSKWKKILIFVVAMLFIGQSVIATTKIYYPHAQSYNAKDKALKDIALWLSDNSLPESSVASIDIGILGYFSERKVVDLTGLINPEKIKIPLTIDYLRKENVTYYLDRHPVPYYLSKEKNNVEKWELKPIIFRSAQSSGWHYNLVETDKIGFSLYKIIWKK